jgi:hypothetical protein
MASHVSTSDILRDRGHSEVTPRRREDVSGCRVVCIRCGHEVTSSTWQPRLKCPGCGLIGAPDRSMRHLLPISWECPTCGKSNNGQANFCLHCGTGLASRCRRCEWPVYGAICLNCGSHQAHLAHLSQRQSERVEWVSIQRQRIDEQKTAQEIREREARASAPAVTASTTPAPGSSLQQSSSRRRRRGPFGWFWRMGWGSWLIIWGAIMLIQRVGRDISSSLTLQDSATTLQSWGTAVSTWFGALASWVTAWWQGFTPTLGRLATLTPDSSEYGILFGSALVGLAVLPIAIFLLQRFVRRLLP